MLSFGSVKPNNFFGLDDDTVVIGCDHASPLQVWDLKSGTKVREFEGSVNTCRSFACIRPRLLAVSCSAGGYNGVSIYDPVSGKLRQRLTGHSNAVSAVIAAPDALISVCRGKQLRVWKRDAKWQVCMPSCSRFFDANSLKLASQR